MSKFKPGDVVICIDADDSDELELHQQYTIDKVDLYSEYEPAEVLLKECSWSWMESRFEPFEEWASQQTRVSAKDELVMAKLQIASLQELKRSQAALLKEFSQAILDTFEHENSWRNWHCLHCNESHKRSIWTDGLNKWEDQHTEYCVVPKARKYLEENV